MADVSETVYEALASEDADGEALAPCAEEALPGNFVKHVTALALTKTGDALIQPKFTLTALLSAMGAPPAAIGLLVPVRESLSMLPQFLESGPVSRLKRRKWAWAAGSVGQGVAVAGMALTAFVSPNAAGGWIIIALLALFAISRSFCSVSFKDVLGVTVAKGARGTVTGTAGTIAAAAALLFGALLATGLLTRSIFAIACVLSVAAGLWLVAGAAFTRLQEPARPAREDVSNPFAVFRHFRSDRQLSVFLLTRALLVGTAMAPPFIMVAAGEDREILSVLGPFILAASAAGFASNYVWGRLADHSSRKVLLLTGIVATVALAGAAALSLSDFNGNLRLSIFVGLLFVLLIAYEGVRMGRSVHLVDMANDETRADYTAATNTLMGVVLIAASGFGWMAEAFGAPVLLAVFAVMSAGAAVTALGLKEVQQD
jgi:hypothetical protein